VGVSGGLAPLAEYEAAPHARVARVPTAGDPALSSPPNSLRIGLLPVDSSALVATLPSALCLRPSPRCSLVFSIQGVLLSLTRSVGSRSPGSPRSAPSPQSPQLGAYAYLAESNPSFRTLCRYLTLALGCLGCLAVVERVVYFSRGPQRMQQHRQFPRHRHNGSLLSILAATFHLGQSPGP
jgi:hypothetical protein